MPYDLLIKEGRVLDPGQDLDGVMDIGITDGKIAAVDKDIPVGEARRHIVVKGERRYVTPGLIDLHTHVAYGLGSHGVNWLAVHPDLVGVGSGVTTLIDAGTCGALDFGFVPTYVAGSTKTRVIYFLNVGSYGLLHAGKPIPDVAEPSHIDVDAIVACVNANPELLKGLKLRLVGPAVESMGRQLVDLSVEAARAAGVPLMTHIGDLMGESPKAPELTDYLISRLQPYDVITHVCTDHSGGLLDANRKVRAPALEARDRGVVMDPAAGRSNWSYEVCRIEADQGFSPDTISTDITTPGREGMVFSLTEIMAKFMAAGYTLEQVVRMTTSNAAKAIRLEDRIGAIKVGYDADLTVLDDVTGKWRFADPFGAQFTGEHALVPVQTVRAGELFAPDWGPHPWGWLPPEA